MQPPFVVLDFPPSPARPDGGSLAFEAPLAVLETHELADVRDLVRELDRYAADGRHAVGFVSYEAAPAFDPALRAPAPAGMPLAWFGVFETARRFMAPHASNVPSASWSGRGDAADYARAVDTIRAAIARGDVYQVNHTVRLDVAFSGDVAALYHRLLQAQGGGYGARIHTGRFEILSASPELFFERDGERIVTRPMKGTARRGRWLGEDNARAAALAASVKERAENVMIVDLIRNDLGRVARPGTVEVPRMFTVERLPTVLQMTSTVTARLREAISTTDIFTALFPCGSVTGAPKVAATKMIADQERDPRGAYCGAIGHIAPGERATFSVGIRTLTIDHETGRAEYGTGSGITWDSANDAEYDEVVAKAGILTADLPRFELIETLRLDRGRYLRLDRHLSRLERSARYFGFAFPDSLRDSARRALEAHAVASPHAVERVRVRVAADGLTTIDADVLRDDDADPGRAPRPVALASSPVRRANRFLYHKTTHRTVYDRHRAEHPDVFDVLLWNEDGELTEFTIGNVVVELDGVQVTPPRECGLLAGTFRAELIADGRVREAIVRREDLARATGLWLVNSVREYVPVTLA